MVNHKRQLVGMVTYKELAAAQNRYVNKVKKKQKQMGTGGQGNEMIAGTKVKAWMLNHVRTGESSRQYGSVKGFQLVAALIVYLHLHTNY